MRKIAQEECYWMFIDQSQTVELNNGFSCWWISLLFLSIFFRSLAPHYEKMMSKPPTDAIANTPREKNINKLELTLFYLRIRISHRYIIQMESWKFIHFSDYYCYSMIFFFLVCLCSCGVVRYQKFESCIRHAENIWFWMAHSALIHFIFD